MAQTSQVASRIKNVAIAGAGGIGAFLAQFLYDQGVSRAQFPFSTWKWTVFDSDDVDMSNLLHQNFTEDDLGRNKAEVVSERTVSGIKPMTRFMTEADFPNYDVIFSCVDSMSFRKSLYEYGWKDPGLYWIDGRCSSRNIGVFNSLVPASRLKPTLNDSEQRGGCLLAIDKEKKVSHITPVVVSAMMTQVFLNHLRGEDTTSDIMLLL